MPSHMGPRSWRVTMTIMHGHNEDPDYGKLVGYHVFDMTTMGYTDVEHPAIGDRSVLSDEDYTAKVMTYFWAIDDAHLKEITDEVHRRGGRIVSIEKREPVRRG